MTLCIKTTKKNGESIRKFLYERDLLNSTLKIANINDELIVPLKRKMTKLEIDELNALKFLYTIIKYNKLEKARVLPKSHLEILQDKLTVEEFAYAPRSFDTIGEIIVIEIPEQIWDKRKLIGKSILSRFNFCNVLI